MSQKSPAKPYLLHSIENNRTNISAKIKTSTENIGINTEQNRDVGTNTPNYAEQIAKALENGNTGEDVVQMLVESKIILCNSIKDLIFY